MKKKIILLNEIPIGYKFRVNSITNLRTDQIPNLTEICFQIKKPALQRAKSYLTIFHMCKIALRLTTVRILTERSLSLD